VKEGTEILGEVNNKAYEVNGQKPFYIIGDLNYESFKFKSYWFKVCCRLCGDFFQLCPPKKNLQANLLNHLEGLKHLKLVADCSTLTRSSSSTLSAGCRKKPTKSAGTV
jgi:hypothetical protein